VRLPAPSTGTRPAAVALAYAVLAVIWAAPSSLAPAERVPDLGDPLHLGWVMAWDAHQLVRRPWALFESNAFHPYPRSLAFADHLLPEALLVAPVFWATGSAVLAYNVAVVLSLTLSALALFLLSRGVGLGVPGLGGGRAAPEAAPLVRPRPARALLGAAPGRRAGVRAGSRTAAAPAVLSRRGAAEGGVDGGG